MENQQEVKPVEDWVQLDAEGIYTKFRGTGKGRKVVKQAPTPVGIKASVSNGIVSISDRGHDIMLAVSIEDMTRIMAGAFDYNVKQGKEGSPCQEAEKETSEAATDAEHK